MKVEIWSDIMCPFCYIGKRKFEAALAQFAGRDAVELSWRSFQLDPDLQAPIGTNVYQYLADRKGQSLAWSHAAHAHVTEAARAVGLQYNYDKAMVANSFDAHRLIQLAKTKALDDAAEERIFRAYFSEGCDIADVATLIRLGKEIGLPEAELMAVLGSDAFAEEVRQDCETAAQLGATGVPFFVFDRKYGVSGAQEPATFLQVLEKAYSEGQSVQVAPQAQSAEGAACDIDNPNC